MVKLICVLLLITYQVRSDIACITKKEEASGLSYDCILYSDDWKKQTEQPSTADSCNSKSIESESQDKMLKTFIDGVETTSINDVVTDSTKDICGPNCKPILCKQITVKNKVQAKDKNPDQTQKQPYDSTPNDSSRLVLI